ncbi:MAG TPA: hypothetical protein V6D28_00640 [Leptolyngbyaceae cyanobacterium]
MQSDQPNQPPLEASNPSQVIIPSEILLGLVTAPLLLGILCGKATLEFMQSVGEASEEVFRGDRLPAIKIPDSPQ